MDSPDSVVLDPGPFTAGHACCLRPQVRAQGFKRHFSRGSLFPDACGVYRIVFRIGRGLLPPGN